ncbi:Redoxin domain protein [Candidatus Sulfopaludibacter sp. SbA6]|nr:Redoxin domain protein [Candidatus Sulfopaludibacter sp. SbA6]
MLSLIASAAMAADLPRKAPELVISLTNGKQVLLSEYKGKVVALCFILTTCPHCQRTIGYLVKDQAEYGPRGFQVLASAIQEGAAAAVPGFIKTYNTPFPVGFNDGQAAIAFMQHPPMLIPHMPLLAFIDKQGEIRAQYEGDDEKFFGDQQEQNLRGQIEALLNEGTGAKTGGAKKSGVPKKI